MEQSFISLRRGSALEILNSPSRLLTKRRVTCTWHGLDSALFEATRFVRAVVDAHGRSEIWPSRTSFPLNDFSWLKVYLFLPLMWKISRKKVIPVQGFRINAGLVWALADAWSSLRAFPSVQAVPRGQFHMMRRHGGWACKWVKQTLMWRKEEKSTAKVQRSSNHSAASQTFPLHLCS